METLKTERRTTPVWPEMTGTGALKPWACAAVAVTLLSAFACDSGGTPEPFELPLESAPLAAGDQATDLGYAVTLSAAHIMVEDLLLKESVEQTATAFLQRGFSTLSNKLLPAAHAHPGHGGGGEVVGELLGRRVVGFAPEAENDIGPMTALPANIEGVDFLIVNATADDDLAVDGAAGEAMVGHAAYLAGRASREGIEVDFEVLLQVDEATLLEDAPLLPNTVSIDDEGASPLQLHFVIDNPFEAESFFDGVDFVALTGEADRLSIGPGTPAHDRIRRALVRHDFYKLTMESGGGDENVE